METETETAKAISRPYFTVLQRKDRAPSGKAGRAIVFRSEIIHRQLHRLARRDIQDNRNPRNLKRDWVVQNRPLFEALCDKGYDVQFTFGTDKHRLDHGGSILPDQLRWLWLDAGGIANGNAPR